FKKEDSHPKLPELLRVVKTRSISGIVPLSVFTRPEDSCPYHCVYCPLAEGAPKSYFPDEAAVRRAIRADYDPIKQTFDRLTQFFYSGHPVDKVDVIVQGGTFSFYPRDYRERFIAGVYFGCNEFGKKHQAPNPKFQISTKHQAPNDFFKLDLEKEKKKNKRAGARVVGLTIETRPDFINEDEVLFLRKLGVTRVELGVQHTDNKVLQIVRRGHTFKDLVKATKLLREAGFKITYHLMPGLPGSSVEKDLQMLKQVFKDERLKPDSIKFYPTQIVWNSELLEWYRQGKYKPLQEKELLKIVLEFKKRIVPPWVRIQRLVRDLTSRDVAVPTFPSNFRQKLEKILKEKGIKCPCIRCREIKHLSPTPPFELQVLEYDANDGKEFFLQYIDLKGRLLGFLRLRLPEHFLKKKNFFIRSIEGSALVRELHVYGPAVSLGKKGKVQHKGLGKALLEKAEDIAKHYGAKKIAVISGVGVRDYYRRQGYELVKEGEYMVKELVV
ncbi:elongator complex protein 3, partial [Persephonella sp.]